MTFAKGTAQTMFCLLATFLIFSGTTALFAEPSEFEVKSAFIFNFLKFVQWEGTHDSESKQPLKVHFLGNGEFERHLVALHGKTASGRPIQVIINSSIEEVEDNSVLILSRSFSEKRLEVTRFLAEKSILSIGDTGNTVEPFTVIQFFMEKNKVRFEINVKRAKAASIHIDTRLLKLARVVQ